MNQTWDRSSQIISVSSWVEASAPIFYNEKRGGAGSNLSETKISI